MLKGSHQEAEGKISHYSSTGHALLLAAFFTTEY